MGEGHITQREEKDKMAGHVLSEPTLRRPRSKSFKYSKKKYQPGIPNLVEISLKIKSEIKTSFYREKVKEFNTNRRMPLKKVKQSFRWKEKDRYKQTKSTRDQYYNSIHLLLYFLYKVMKK